MTHITDGGHFDKTVHAWGAMTVVELLPTNNGGSSTMTMETFAWLFCINLHILDQSEAPIPKQTCDINFRFSLQRKPMEPRKMATSAMQFRT
jgi:hypothetical protein